MEDYCYAWNYLFIYLFIYSLYFPFQREASISESTGDKMMKFCEHVEGVVALNEFAIIFQKSKMAATSCTLKVFSPESISREPFHWGC